MPLFVLASLIVASNFFAISFARASRERECREYGTLLDQIKKDEAIARQNNPNCPRCMCVDSVTHRVSNIRTRVPREQHNEQATLWMRIRMSERTFRKKFDRAYFGVLPYARKAWHVILRAVHIISPYAIGFIIGIIAQRCIFNIARKIRYHIE